MATAAKIRDEAKHATGFDEAAYCEIAKAQVKAGDLAGAEATAAQLDDKSLAKVQVYCWIAGARTQTRDPAKARTSLELAKAAAAQIREEAAKAAAYRCRRRGTSEGRRHQRSRGDGGADQR